MPQPRISDLRPFIPAKDFALCKRFYSSLGWETRDVDKGLALVRLAEQQHFYLQDYYVREFAENTMLHATVDSAQAWYERVSGVLADDGFPAARVQPPQPQPYGALVVFVHDPSGVLLHLCQWN